jgi:predicted ferric reductase
LHPANEQYSDEAYPGFSEKLQEKNMSRILALISLFFFAVSLLTALRSRVMTRFIGSLTFQFRLHHWLGWLTALLFFAHVILELLHTPAAFRTSMILTTDPPLLAAWLAVLIFIVALILSYQRKLKFRIWRLWHMLFPLAFGGAMFHAIAFAADEWRDQLIIYGSFGLGGLSLLILGLGYFWNPVARHYKIHALEKTSATVWELLLEPKGRAVSQEPCRAGQIIYLRFLNHAFSRALHPFSVASCRLEPYLRLYIKSLGRDTSHLQDLKLHEEVEVYGPFAELKLALDREQIWIGGGIGIAPFLGFLHCTQALQTPPIHVLHFISRSEEIVDNADIRRLRETAPSLSWHNIVDEKGHRPNLERLDAVLKSSTRPRIVICGPNPFMRMIRHHLLQGGISPQDIITEEFIL